MNILIIPSWYNTKNNPTNGSFFREQAIALKEQGHNVIIAFTEVTLEHLSAEDKKVNFYNDDGIKTYRIKIKKIRKTGNLGTSFAIKCGIKKMIDIITKDEDIDLIHLHSCIWGGIGAIWAKKKIRKPLIITEHSSFYSRYKVSFFEKLMIRYVTRNCDRLICVSEALKKTMSQYRNDIIVIPNMVNGSCFKYSDLKNDGRFKFMSVCYLNSNKNIDILISAYAEVSKVIDAELIIGGSGPEEMRLKSLAKSLGVFDKVTFTGALSREDVVETMRKCNVLILPSKIETFGVVLTEALFTGRPVITTKNGGALDIVNDNNGIVVDVNNIRQLSDAMISMYENYEKYDKKKISMHAREKFDKINIVRQIEVIYNDVL